jgi:hypothetical protein
VVLILLLTAAAIWRTAYRSGKRTGSRKGYHVGYDHGRRRNSSGCLFVVLILSVSVLTIQVLWAAR